MLCAAGNCNDFRAATSNFVVTRRIAHGAQVMLRAPAALRYGTAAFSLGGARLLRPRWPATSEQCPSSPDTMSFCSEHLARWASTLTFEDLPADVVESTKLRVLDVIGLALAGL